MLTLMFKPFDKSFTKPSNGNKRQVREGAHLAHLGLGLDVVLRNLFGLGFLGCHDLGLVLVLLQELRIVALVVPQLAPLHLRHT